MVGKRGGGHLISYLKALPTPMRRKTGSPLYKGVPYIQVIFLVFIGRNLNSQYLDNK